MKLSKTATFAFVFIALLEGAQFLVIGRLVSAEQSLIEQIKLDADARLQTQRAAYLATTAYIGEPEPTWSNKAAESIQIIRAEQRVTDVSAESLRALGPAAQTGFDDRVDRYLTALRMLILRPRDSAAYGALRALRPDVQRSFSRLTDVHVESLRQLESATTTIIIGGRTLQFAVLVAIFFGFIRPSERRLRALLDRVVAEREQMQSLFDDNPDAIAVFDDKGLLVRANRSRAKLLESAPEQMLGKHFTAFVPKASAPLLLEAFDLAVKGKPSSGELDLCRSTGQLVAVHLNVFPHVVDGVRAGVISVARDLTEIKTARLAAEELARRLAALCAIVSVGGDWHKQVEAAILLAANALTCEWGFGSEIGIEGCTVFCAVGDIPNVHVGDLLAHDMLMQTFVAGDDIVDQADLAHLTSPAFEPWRVMGWRSFLGMRLMIDGRVWGAFALGSAQSRATTLSSADCDFLRIAAALIVSIIERGRQHERLDTLAFLDTLTGLPNRAYVALKLDELISAGNVQPAEFALHFIDLDRFKDINDAAGHAMGDRVLRAIAKRFIACVRATDVVARIGGDEFLIIQPLTDGGRTGASELAERVSQAARAPITYDGQTFVLGCSIGISLYPNDGYDMDILLRRADEAMYRAKAALVGSVAFVG